MPPTPDLHAHILAAIDRTEQRARAATPGPWEYGADDEVFSVHHGEHGDRIGDMVCYTRGKEMEVVAL